MKHRSFEILFIAILAYTVIISSSFTPERGKTAPVIYPVIPLEKGMILNDSEGQRSIREAVSAEKGYTKPESRVEVHEAAVLSAVEGSEEPEDQAEPAGEQPDHTAVSVYCESVSELESPQGADGDHDSEGAGAEDGDQEYIESVPELVEPEGSEEPEQYDTGEVGGSGDYGCAGSDAGGSIGGIKEVPEEAESEDCGLTYLGTWTATAYCACPICCGSYSSGYTASGTLATEGRTVACNCLPMGTQLMINGNVYTVEDTGWSPYGDAWVDIFFESHESALAFGMQQVEVYLIAV